MTPHHAYRDEYVAPIPEAERHDLMLGYNAQLNAGAADEETRLVAAHAWTKWEFTTSKLYVDPAHIAEAEKDDFAKCVSALSAFSHGRTRLRPAFLSGASWANIRCLRNMQCFRKDREPLFRA